MKKGLIAALTAIMVIGAPVTSFASEGWQEVDGIWHYGNSSGGFAKDCWKKYGDEWYYLNSNGYMLTNSFIDDNNDLYYVDEDGAMVSSQWRYLNRNGQESWYYFGNDGKAYKNTSSTKAKLRMINGSNYLFDDNGRMLYGWVDEQGDACDSFEDGIYYCGDVQDGSVKSGWVLLDVDCDHDDCDGTHWFYFNNGKKVVDKDSYSVNNKRYGFDEDGIMHHGFTKVSDATPSNATSNYKYYSSNDDGANARSSWFKTIPSKDIDVNGYDDEDSRWFYANSDGTLKANQIARIKNKKYAFNNYGEMVYGLCGLKFDGDDIVSVIENIESLSQLNSAVSDGHEIYYFHDEDDGHMETSSVKIELDGEEYKFKFSSNGVANNGIVDDCLYVNGRLIHADKGDDYCMFELDGTKSHTIGTAYLLNESGKVQKNKHNVKDDYGYYYCTDGSGLVTYKSTIKK